MATLLTILLSQKKSACHLRKINRSDAIQKGQWNFSKGHWIPKWASIHLNANEYFGKVDRIPNLRSP